MVRALVFEPGGLRKTVAAGSRDGLGPDSSVAGLRLHFSGPARLGQPTPRSWGWSNRSAGPHSVAALYVASGGPVQSGGHDPLGGLRRSARLIFGLPDRGVDDRPKVDQPAHQDEPKNSRRTKKENGRKEAALHELPQSGNEKTGQSGQYVASGTFSCRRHDLLFIAQGAPAVEAGKHGGP